MHDRFIIFRFGRGRGSFLRRRLGIVIGIFVRLLLGRGRVYKIEIIAVQELLFPLAEKFFLLGENACFLLAQIFRVPPAFFGKLRFGAHAFCCKFTLGTVAFGIKLFLCQTADFRNAFFGKSAFCGELDLALLFRVGKFFFMTTALFFKRFLMLAALLFKCFLRLSGRLFQTLAVQTALRFKKFFLFL